MSNLTRDENGVVDRWHSYPIGRGLSISVNERLANEILQRLPEISPSMKAADRFWKFVWPTVMVGGFVALIWLPVWWPPIVGIFLGLVIFRASTKSAADFVGQVATGNPEFCGRMVEAGVIRID